MMTRMHGRTTPDRIAVIRAGVAGALLAVSGLFGGGCSKEVSDRDIRPIALADAAKLHARSASNPTVVLFIDPRPSTAYAQMHVPGARNLVMRADDQDRGTDPAIDRYETLVVYGDRPNSAIARAMTKRMMAAGYSKKKVKLMDDGLSAWRAAGLPVDGAGAD